MNLYDALTQYCSSDAYPFHMPGHKRRAAHLCDPSAIDVTEIDGFDNLHHAEGILKEAQLRAASLYGSEETYFLVNGSTAGILSAIAACTLPGSCLVMARNSHRSAFHAAALSRVRTAYLYPSRMGRVTCCKAKKTSCENDLNGPIDPSQVEEMLSHQEHVSAVFLTSPTYDGVVSDVAQIAQIAHRHGIPLIVDEAHGAHFGMHRIFPESSVKLGADLVIHSLHKTLPALTQTALIHANGTLADRERLRFFLNVYQTSSPSYVLMASIDQCIRLLADQGNDLFDAYAGRLLRFYEKTRLVHYAFLKTDDPSRILVRPPAGVSAMQLYHALRERFHLQPEMAAGSYVLLLSSLCDEDEGFSRLMDALVTLDREYAVKTRLPGKTDPPRSTPSEGFSAVVPEPCGTIAEALDDQAETVSFSESEGMISAEFLMLYPPGVPLLVPGERITAGIIRHALAMYRLGYSVQGLSDHSLQKIRVIHGCRRQT